MADIIENATFIPDERKLAKNLTAGDMFDRIINLKLRCINVDKDSPQKGMTETFVIRSDYEMIYSDNGLLIDGTTYPTMKNQCVIRRCSMKPSIKVQCKMVSTSTGTNIDVFINNFFMLTEDGKHIRSFNNSQYKIDTVEIVMGYWGQFKNNKPATPDEYFTLKAENGADKITLTGAIVVTTDKLPPDSTLHIKGFVGDIYSSPVAVSEIKTADVALKNPVTSSGKGFERVCFDMITRRYLNKHSFTDQKGDEIKVGKRNVAVSDIASFPVPVKFDEKTGLMSEEDAKKYGVKVYLSKEAKKLAIPKAKDENDEEKDKTIYFEAGWTAGQTVGRLMSFMEAELGYTFNNHGDVLIYCAREVTDPEELYKAFDADGMYNDTPLTNKALYGNKLPAVYNINVDTVATIVCPFFTFLEPFQYVEFASRYAITSLVGYFASYAPTIYRFLVINATITFATVDDVNEVQMTAVSARDATIN